MLPVKCRQFCLGLKVLKYFVTALNARCPGMIPPHYQNNYVSLLGKYMFWRTSEHHNTAFNIALKIIDHWIHFSLPYMEFEVASTPKIDKDIKVW